MALPDTLERIGIVVGSALMGMLPTSTLLVLLVSDLSTLTASAAVAVWYLPGVVVGVLVALDYLPVTYDEFWLFCILSWLFSFGLWATLGSLGPPDASRLFGVATWALAVVFAGLVTWRREWLLGAVASEPEKS